MKKTALYNSHTKLNAKMVDFGGWSMPIQYNSILSESKSVRTKSGVFDVSHMGRIEISGNDSSEILNQILSINIGFLNFGWIDIIDIVLVSIILFQLYKLVRGSVAVNIFIGLLAVYLFYLVVRAAEMELLSAIFGQFIASAAFDPFL